MKYNVGDRVRIKSLDWYRKYANKDGIIVCGNYYFTQNMLKYCGKVLIITNVIRDFYVCKDIDYQFSDEMIEGLVEEETVLNKWNGLKVELELSKSVIGVSNIESLHGERFMSGFVKAIIPPDGYIFKDENGNVINATKIVLEKKKKEYPKTYKECSDILSVYTDPDIAGYKGELLWTFQKLLICRDAYWKIAGEEMGLGKPWENGRCEVVYGICRDYDDIVKQDDCWGGAHIFEFPTREMRDAFYENFKKEIEDCKELL